MPRATPEQVAQATDQVVALYRAGESLQTIVERTGIGRTTIRKILLAEGVPRRPPGHPRLSVSSEAVAALYESGLTMTETANRLKINPNAAWARYLEVRDRRGVTPGKWHQVLLEALDTSPALLVIATATAAAGRPLSRTEAAAARRAARELDRVGVADLGHVTATWNGQRAAYLSLARPGVDANDAAQLDPLVAIRTGSARDTPAARGADGSRYRDCRCRSRPAGGALDRSGSDSLELDAQFQTGSSQVAQLSQVSMA